jgi:hypothetical protein
MLLCKGQYRKQTGSDSLSEWLNLLLNNVYENLQLEVAKIKKRAAQTFTKYNVQGNQMQNFMRS